MANNRNSAQDSGPSWTVLPDLSESSDEESQDPFDELFSVRSSPSLHDEGRTAPSAPSTPSGREHPNTPPISTRPVLPESQGGPPVARKHTSGPRRRNDRTQTTRSDLSEYFSNAAARPSGLPVVSSPSRNETVSAAARLQSDQRGTSSRSPPKGDTSHSKKRRLSSAFSSSDEIEIVGTSQALTSMSTVASKAVERIGRQRAANPQAPDFLAHTSFGRLLAKRASNLGSTNLPALASISAPVRSKPRSPSKRLPAGRSTVSATPERRQVRRRSVVPQSADVIVIDSSDDDNTPVTGTLVTSTLVTSALKPSSKPQFKIDDSGAIVISSDDDDDMPGIVPLGSASQNAPAATSVQESAHHSDRRVATDPPVQDAPADYHPDTLMASSPAPQDEQDDAALDHSSAGEDSMPEVAAELGHLTMGGDSERDEPEIPIQDSPPPQQHTSHSMGTNSLFSAQDGFFSSVHKNRLLAMSSESKAAAVQSPSIEDSVNPSSIPNNSEPERLSLLELIHKKYPTTPTKTQRVVPGDETSSVAAVESRMHRPSSSAPSSTGSISSLADAINSMKASRSDSVHSSAVDAAADQATKSTSRASVRITPSQVAESSSLPPLMDASALFDEPAAIEDVPFSEKMLGGSDSDSSEDDKDDSEVSDLLLSSHLVDSEMNPTSPQIMVTDLQPVMPALSSSPTSVNGISKGLESVDISSAAQDFAWTEKTSGFINFNLLQHEAVAKEFASFSQLAKDLPHDIEDELNSLPFYARQADNMQRKIFEAIIAANTADDEPFSPCIQIINHVDNELTPPIEFHYSNLMWHDDGVPLPDFENLPHCDCYGGRCDPNSKTCLCVQRQSKYMEEEGRTGFIFDQNGRLQLHGYPIFECNALCGCTEDCPNRVVQNGRKYAINIQKTPNKGWGVFASNQKIPAHTFIGIYSGEYLTEQDANKRGIVYNKFGRTYLFDLDFWYLYSKDEDGNIDDQWKSKYSIDAYHAGNFTRYLNHSCDPNCVVNPCYINEPNIEKPLVTIFTLRDVAAGEELCFSYFGLPDGTEDEDEDEDEEMTNKVQPDDAIYVKCECGARNCRGRMWS